MRPRTKGRGLIAFTRPLGDERLKTSTLALGFALGHSLGIELREPAPNQGRHRGQRFTTHQVVMSFGMEFNSMSHGMCGAARFEHGLIMTHHRLMLSNSRYT